MNITSCATGMRVMCGFTMDIHVLAVTTLR